MSGWIWEPTPEWIRKTNVYRFMTRLGFEDREEFLRFSRERPEKFWDGLVRETGIGWFEPYHTVLDESRGPAWARWFLGGTLNIAWNCLDRHAALETPALLGESEGGEVRVLSYRELAREVNRLANALRGLGLRAGDRVALCMPMVPEVVVGMYACFKLGLIALPIFSGFGAGAIATRLADSGARVVLTADSVERRGKRLPLKAKLDEALAEAPAVERVIVWRYRGGEVPWTAGRDLWWDQALAGQSEECASAVLDSEAPALLLYTSGTTGRPKGALHSHAGALVQTVKEIYLAFDHQPGDRFFWLSDIGWMMGAWELIGNHHLGGTVMLYDGAPDHPSAGRLWSLLERHRINTFGVSPTAIRLLMRRDAEAPARFDLSSLRLLGSTGEPWDEPSYRWFFEQAGGGRCPIINISGGTEILGCFVFPLPIQPLKACSVGGPAPGMAAEVFDESGCPVRGRTGYLVCTQPSPSMTRGLWNDPGRYIETYWSRWPGVWNHGDWASVDQDGCWFLHGRADESMNVAGRKVGPAEIEESLMEHPAVAEAAVIGVPDELTGEAPVAFAVLKAEVEAEELCRWVAGRMGAAFRPRAVEIVPELPKTQSGKIVRRLLRQRYLGEEAGDLSTLANPEALGR